MKRISLRLKVVIPITVSLCILLGAFIYNTYQTQTVKFSHDVERNLLEVEGLFEKQITSETELLDSIIEMIEVNQEIQKAWVNKDREALFDLCAPLLGRLEAKYRITHFYFHDSSRKNFLRVYDPSRFGDTINRLTILKAEKTGLNTSGLEIGKLGTLTLRVVHPWKINNKIVGYIELGEEIHHIFEKLHEILDIELLISVYKEYLDKQSWEKGMELFQIPHDWNLLQSSVIVNRTLPNIPKQLGDFLQKGAHKYMQMDTKLKIAINKERYRVGVLPMFDVDGREVGDIVVLYNVAKQLQDFRKNMSLAALFSLLIGISLFVFFVKYLGKLEADLKRHENHLKDLVDERTKKLTDALNEIKTLKGIIPICSYCKQIRDDRGSWSQIESYLQQHSEAEFSHGICPKCAEIHHPEYYKE